ncbi:MAG: 50S ribosomal protein L13 [bacterium]
MKKQETFYPKEKGIVSNWVLIDAEDKILGRVASEAAKRLIGKCNSEYTPGVDTGDFVVIINAEKVRVTGNKETQKKYYRHTGYTGHLKVKTFKELKLKKPEDILRKAIKGMLPHNKYGSKLATKMKLYVGPNHPHEAQNPKTMEIRQ